MRRSWPRPARDFFVCPDNTAHIALESPGEPFPIPGLHIGEVVAEQARARRPPEGRHPRHQIYDDRAGLSRRARPARDRLGGSRTKTGRSSTTSSSTSCASGRFRDESRDAYVRIIEKLKQDGCDAVALVCTEIPLLITQEVSPLPILDSTRLLAEAAVEVAIGERPMPEWRGGPLS